MRTPERKNNYSTVFLIVFIVTMIFRIPLGYLIGTKGMAYFGTANEICLLLAGAFGYGLSEAAALLIRYRMKRDQIRSAQKVVKGTFTAGFGIGLLLSLLVGGTAHILAEQVFRIPLAGMAVRIISPAITLYILTGVFKGYFQGNGSKIPAMHSMILNVFFLYVGGLVGAAVMHGYGKKVSALLQNEDYASAYGALGAAIGVLAASVFCFLHMLILYLLLRSRLAGQMGRELQRNQDTIAEVFRLLLGNGGLYTALSLVFGSRILLDQYILYHFSGIEQGIDGIWGAYYGKYLVVTGIVVAIALLICLLPVKRIVMLAEHNEYRSVRERMGVLIHQCALLVIPGAVFLAVLSENIMDLFYKGNNAQAASWLQIGSIGLVFAVFAVVFMELFLRLRKTRIVVLIGTASLLIHIISAILLFQVTDLGVEAVVIANNIFWILIAGAGFVMIGRMLQYSQEWIRSFALPVVAAAVAGLIIMLLNKALVSLVGNIVSLILCLLVASVLYLILLLVLKDFSEAELEIMPGGKRIRMFAGMLRLM